MLTSSSWRTVLFAFLIQGAAAWYQPSTNTTWQIQYGGQYLDESVPATVYNIDGFNATKSLITDLHNNGHKVICYFSAGSYENFRPDKSSFPASVLGKVLDGWPDEKWLDIRQVSILQPIMNARAQMGQSKGCDGIDWDNVDGYINDSGFDLSYDDQITYNTMLSSITHNLNMAVGLKNDLDQINDLLPSFDFAVNESCQEYNECDTLKPFIAAGKPVWAISYAGLSKTSTCALPNSLGFQMLLKNLDLDAPVYSCTQQLSAANGSTPTSASTTATSSTTSSRTKSSSSSSTSPRAAFSPAPTATSSTSSTSQAERKMKTSSTLAAACATIAGTVVCSTSTTLTFSSSTSSTTKRTMTFSDSSSSSSSSSTITSTSKAGTESKATSSASSTDNKRGGFTVKPTSSSDKRDDAKTTSSSIDKRGGFAPKTTSSSDKRGGFVTKTTTTTTTSSASTFSTSTNKSSSTTSAAKKSEREGFHH